MFLIELMDTKSQVKALSMAPTQSPSTVLLNDWRTCPVFFHNNRLSLSLYWLKKSLASETLGFWQPRSCQEEEMNGKKALAYFVCFHVWRPTSVNQYLPFVNVPCMCAGPYWPGKSNLWPSYHYKRVVWCLGKPLSPQARQLRILLLGEWKKMQKGRKDTEERNGSVFKKAGANTRTNLGKFLCPEKQVQTRWTGAIIWKSEWLEWAHFPCDRFQ